VLIGGVIPFPGAQLVLAVMLVNLSGSMVQMLFKPKLPVVSS